jgi:hypothetical protein
MKQIKQLVAAVERNGKTYWTRIGVAFENRDGSWNLKFDFVPTSPGTTIQLRDVRRDDNPAVADEAGDDERGITAQPF